MGGLQRQRQIIAGT